MKKLNLVFEQQIWNYLGLAFLLALTVYFWGFPGMSAGSLWGLGTPFWFWLSIGEVILHSFYAWFVFRAELHLGLMTKWFGRRAFTVWAVSFTILLVLRFLLMFTLGYSNRGTWAIPPWLGWLITSVIAIPAFYTIYSIKRYFSFKRGVGADHFDPAYRKMGLVHGGIYKYTSNAMYIFLAAVVWVPALVFGSKAVLVSAFFNHAYLWVLYYTLERPDMKRIYSIK